LDLAADEFLKARLCTISEFCLACAETMTFRRSIYEPLHQRLLSERGQIVRLTFSEIEEILRRKLPASAHKFTAWWSNESSVKAGHTQARAWMNAGFRAHASITSRSVQFRRA
jgi:hypothetical protein